MLSFRQKILIVYVTVCSALIGLLFPFAQQTVKGIALKAMSDRADEFISRARDARNEIELIKLLHEQQSLFFFRVSVINDKRRVIYDSHGRASEEHTFTVSHPEVSGAFKRGIDFNEEYSELLGQRFFYMAKTFNFHGRNYVMRTAFPWRYVVALVTDYEFGFLGMAIAVLLLFSIMSWAIINHLTRPIQQIITAIKPYLEGRTSVVPEIVLTPANRSDEFGKLAKALNSLSERIQNQIDKLTVERNEKEAILESLIEGVVAVDDHLIVTYANNMALKILESSEEELVGKHFIQTKQELCLALLKECRQTQKAVTGELQMKLEGNKIYLSIVAAPKKEEAGAILVLQDKSAHYNMLEMRKDFIANASHELKTPITIIRGFAETLHDAPDLPLETREVITEKIVRNCQRMANLIQNLMTLSDIENIPRSKLIKCDLGEIVDHCVQIVQQLFPEAEIDIDQPEPYYHFIGEPNLMELAIINLIENAAKYSPYPAHITISFEHDQKWVKLAICDRGIGISREDLPHIFQRFYTVDKAHSQKLGGAGLGLSIVETIIEKHAGKIIVESEVGQGSIFTIYLPSK